MPTYSWTCLSCGGKQEVTFPVRLRPNRIMCDVCGKTCERDYQAEQGHLAHGEHKGWPRASVALGVHPNQIPHFEAQHPGEHWNPDGTMVVRSQFHQRQLCKKLNLVDRCEYFR